MTYYIYKITNNINGRYYFGKRHYSGLNANNDSYLGSGTAITSAVKKYGKENFSKLVIAYAKDSEDLKSLEKRIIGNLYETDPKCYNLKAGGDKGGLSKETKLKISKAASNPSKATRKKMAIAKLGVTLTAAHKNKISNALKGNIKSELTKEKMSIAKRNPTDETRKRLSKANSGVNNPMYGKKLTKITCPHCGKVGAGGAMSRYHFDNCKKKGDHTS